MSRTQKLFSKVDLSLHDTYFIYHGKDIYITIKREVTMDRKKENVWMRGKVCGINQTYMSVHTFRSNDSLYIGHVIEILLPEIISVKLAGKDIYDDIIRR
jgi:hypothetical protein